jgi:hypothetical protein
MTPPPLESPLGATRGDGLRGAGLQPVLLLAFIGIQYAAPTRTSRNRRIRASSAALRGKTAAQKDGVSARHGPGIDVPDARPLQFETARNRSDRDPAQSTRQLRLEDFPGAAPGGLA